MPRLRIDAAVWVLGRGWDLMVEITIGEKASTIDTDAMSKAAQELASEIGILLRRFRAEWGVEPSIVSTGSPVRLRFYVEVKEESR